MVSKVPMEEDLPMKERSFEAQVLCELNNIHCTVIDTQDMVMDIKKEMETIQAQVSTIVEQVAPLVEQVANSPIMKMMGGGKKRG